MRILIADDETPIREWIQFSIERGKNPNYEIVGVAENGNEAYKLALEQQVDTVITDIKMPGMDGLELMKRLQKEMPYVSFIILTNHAEFSYAREALTYGAKKYMLKSEMQGKDILEALKEIKEGTDKLLEGKEEDCYSSGYLDIYNCCYHDEDMEYVRSFWQKHYFADRLQFQVLGMKLGDTRYQKQLLDDYIKSRENHILTPILRRDSIYLVIQAETEVELGFAASAFCRLWEAENQGIVVASQSDRGAEQVLKQIDEAEKMLRYGFFFESGFFLAAQADGWRRLEREKIWKEYKRILGGVLNEEKELLLTQIEAWFAGFYNEVFSAKDTGWAREICVKLVMRMEEIFAEHFSGYRDEQEPEKIGTIAQCRELCRELVEKLYSGENISYSQSVRDAIQYIYQYYGNQDLSLKEVAKSIYRSPEYLSRLFKAETGKNFSTYLMDYRLAKAKTLLLETDMKIYEIAYVTGYTSASYFSRVYHEYTGMTPEMTRSQNSDRMSEK